MTDDEIRRMVAAGRAWLLDALIRDLRRLAATGQTHQLRWAGPGLVDRAWELLADD